MNEKTVAVPLSEIDELRLIERMLKHLSVKVDNVLQPHIDEADKDTLMQSMFDFSNRLEEFHSQLHSYISIKIAEMIKEYGFDKQMYEILQEQIKSFTKTEPIKSTRKLVSDVSE